MAESGNELLSMEEAGAYLEVDPAAARRLLNAAGITQRIGKRVLVVSQSDLEKYGKERREKLGVPEGKIGPGRPKKTTEATA